MDESLDDDDEPTLPPYVKRAPTHYVAPPSNVVGDDVGAPYTEAEYERLLLAAGDLRTQNLARRRNRAIVIVLRHTGMRRQEIAGLLVSDYETRTGHIRVRNSVAKRTRRENDSRTVALHNSPKVEFDKYVRILKAAGKGAGPLFPSERKGGKALRHDAINQMVNRLAEKVRATCPNKAQHSDGMGCEEGCIRWADLHRWRSTWAIRSFEAGVPLQSVMAAGGWADPSLPMRYARKALDGIALRDFERVNGH